MVIAAPAKRREAALWTALIAAAIALGTLVATQPIVATVIFGVGILGILVLRGSVMTLLTLTVVALILGSTNESVPGGTVYFASKFVLLAAIGLTIVPLLARPPTDRRVSVPFAVALLILTAYALASTLWSAAPSSTLSRAISLLVLWLAVAVAIPRWWNTPEEAMSLIVRIGWLGAATVVLGLLASAIGVVQGSIGGRWRGILVNPNTLGYFLAPVLPALVIIAANAHGKRRRGLIAVILVLGVGLVMTGSRAGALSAILGSAAGVLAARRSGQRLVSARVARAGVIGIFAAVGILLATHHPFRPPGTGGISVSTVGTGSNRTLAWAQGLGLIAQHPVVGHGFATAAILFPQQEHLPDGALSGNMHNSYLETAYDLGWFASASVVLLAGSGLLVAWRLARGGGPWRVLATVLIAGISGGLVDGMFESGLLAAGGLLAFPFWLMVGTAHSMWTRSRSGPRQPRLTIWAKRLPYPPDPWPRPRRIRQA